MMGGLTESGNGRVLWMLGQVGGVAVSSDMGRNWRDVPLQTGGDQIPIAMWGATEAWLPVWGRGIFRTLNGTTWSKLK